MGQALTLSTVITKAHWVLGVAVLWGFYRLLNVPRLRWLLMSHVYLVFLYMLCAGSSSWLARELTGFWYNDAQRVAALIPMTAVRWPRLVSPARRMPWAALWAGSRRTSSVVRSPRAGHWESPAWPCWSIPRPSTPARASVTG